MTTEAALSAGVAALWLKAPLVTWLSICLLLLVDRRRIICVPWLLLSLTALAASFTAWAATENSPYRAAWLVSLAGAAGVLILGARAWVSQGSAALLGRRLALLLAIVGILASGLAVLQPLTHSANIRSPLQLLAAMHLIAVSLALALGIVSSIELTFLSSPDTLGDAPPGRVRWRWLAWLALLTFGTHIIIGWSLLTSSWNAVDQDTNVIVLSRGFAMCIVVIQFVAWMIPQRLYQFQRTQRATGWSSLTLAAWMTVLSLAIVGSLPTTWPWRDF